MLFFQFILLDLFYIFVLVKTSLVLLSDYQFFEEDFRSGCWGVLGVSCGHLLCRYIWTRIIVVFLQDLQAGGRYHHSQSVRVRAEDPNYIDPLLVLAIFILWLLSGVALATKYQPSKSEFQIGCLVVLIVSVVYFVLRVVWVYGHTETDSNANVEQVGAGTQIQAETPSGEITAQTRPAATPVAAHEML